MNQEDFISLVGEDVKEQLDEERSHWLRSPEICRQWLAALIDTRTLTQYRIHARRNRLRALAAELGLNDPPVDPEVMEEYLEAKKEFEAWHRRTLRWLQGVNEKISEARRIVEENPDKASLSRLLITLIILKDILSGKGTVEDAQKVIEAALAEVLHKDIEAVKATV